MYAYKYLAKQISYLPYQYFCICWEHLQHNASSMMLILKLHGDFCCLKLCKMNTYCNSDFLVMRSDLILWKLIVIFDNLSLTRMNSGKWGYWNGGIWHKWCNWTSGSLCLAICPPRFFSTTQVPVFPRTYALKCNTDQLVYFNKCICPRWFFFKI